MTLLTAVRHPGLRGRGRQARHASLRDIRATKRADALSDPLAVYHSTDTEPRYYRVHLGLMLLVRLDGPATIEDAMDYADILVGSETDVDYITRKRIEMASESRIASVTVVEGEEVSEADIAVDWP